MSWIQHQTKTLFGGSPQACQISSKCWHQGNSVFFFTLPNPPRHSSSLLSCSNPSQNLFSLIQNNAVFTKYLMDMPCGQQNKPEVYCIEYTTFETMCQVTLGKQSFLYPSGKTSGCRTRTAPLSSEAALEGLLCFKAVPFVRRKK